MTDAQEQAIADVKKILGEHFDAYLLTVKAEIDDESDEHPSFWDGGFSNVVGLAHIAAHSVMLPSKKTEETES